MVTDNDITIVNCSSTIKKMNPSGNSIYQFCLAYSGLLIQIVTLLYNGIDISTSLISMFDNPRERLDSLIFSFSCSSLFVFLSGSASGY